MTRAVVPGRLGAVTAGAPAFPLALLFGLNFVDEIDRLAFATLSPEIRDAFGLSDTAIGAIGSIVSVFILLAAVPLGYVADRVNRVWLVAGAALLWGTMSALTGVVATVALLFAVRLLAGLGRVSNEVVHPSLLTDYYPPQVHPRVFQLHRLAGPLSQVSAIAAGALAAACGWRWAFILLSIPTFLLLVFVVRLRDPGRTRSRQARDAAGRDAGGGRGLPFAAGTRLLLRIRTLRRLWLAALLSGTALVALPQMLSLFLSDVFELEAAARGAALTTAGAGQVAGLFIGGRQATRASSRDDWYGVATVAGRSALLFASGVVVLGWSPSPATAFVVMFVMGVGGGAFLPPYLSLVGRVSPGEVRSQAYAWAVFCLGVGTLASIPLYALGEASGFRIAMTVFGLIVMAGAVTVATARRFAAADAAALRSRDGDA
ncbi:MFS-type efflux pump [Planobispora rosea]|uniref:MFS-type efflux pump n=1 Tax=Planobispora rosea TaxID=35762 RepID=A0A8J3S022_PLARO|nr:MFS transporter [Planobispora rosea]GGS49438.1 MFS-type efflux pump [Planobispora rosea]GIH83800.1 MFS-type efflux pump [Planobispora rosea]